MGRLLLGAICLAAGLAAAQDFSKIQIKVTKVAGNVYMLEGAGGNIGVSVGEDGIVVVDDQFAPLADKIEAALKGITDKPVRFIINTHWHYDHTGGNAHFGKEGPILAHENVRSRMVSGGKILGQDVKPSAKEELPVITFNDTASIHLNGEEIRAVHFPSGHTDGDAIVFFTGSNVVHMGDDFFSTSFPFIDLESGGSTRGMIAACEKVIATLPPDVKAIPGHGPLRTVGDLKEYVAMLKDTYARVEAGFKQGKTLEQLKQEKVLAGYEKWAGGFFNLDKFTETLYNDVTGNKAQPLLRHN